MKIPFGKYKGKNFEYLDEYDETEYVNWLSENCYDMIEKKHPEFLKFLEDNFYVFRKRKFKPSSYSEHTGVLIKNFEDYRNFIVDVNDSGWKDSTEEEIYKHFKKPKQYPFLATLFQNSLDAFNNYYIQKIYIANRPTVYVYRESYYD